MIFTIEDNFKKKTATKLNKFYNANNLIELEYIKLIMGLSKIKFKGKYIKQNLNYCVLGIKENTLEDFGFEKIVNFLYKEASIQYFNNNRRNNKLFRILLNETGLYFISKKLNNNIEGFIHLYRIIEKISIMFPLVYFKQSYDFAGVYSDVKDLVTSKEISSLKFFKNFQKKIFEDVAMLDTTTDFNFILSNDEEKNDLFAIYNIVSREQFDISLNGNTISMSFKDIVSFAITIRNRYFHLSMENKENIEVINLNMNYFFSVINEPILNWICVMYYELFKALNK